ncbi:thiamine phosphate synthase [Neisseria zoodegmatis]|uniref:Thiamine-phosphate synthase n=1 Tax=Neisseria zoodegmatis TaxID=326523 RepID=A0AB38DTJ9_9NEIS|nr:thiamine phosphate synthase [Neisseria zoodegmatis]OSI09096.1 thiamine-phosphate diphosphorylase [Neisseria zoodegmatis]SNU80687.1 thiamin-phosphate pyrophosphorylase [Neisseria zoodegmatis]
MVDIRRALNLYLVAGTQDCNHLSNTPERNLLGVLEQALQHGITCYQLREKGAGSLQDKQRILQLAEECRDLCRQYEVPFFIDDDIQMALAVGADGVHLGQSDMPVAEAAALCEGRLLIGLSHNTLAEIEASRHNAALDYCAIGPIFPTQSKEKPNPTVGIERIRQIRALDFDRPLVAIGGITAGTAAEVRAAGADGIAVISAITRAGNVGQAVKDLLA